MSDTRRYVDIKHPTGDSSEFHLDAVDRFVMRRMYRSYRYTCLRPVARHLMLDLLVAMDSAHEWEQCGRFDP